MEMFGKMPASGARPSRTSQVRQASRLLPIARFPDASFPLPTHTDWFRSSSGSRTAVKPLPGIPESAQFPHAPRIEWRVVHPLGKGSGSCPSRTAWSLPHARQRPSRLRPWLGVKNNRHRKGAVALAVPSVPTSQSSCRVGTGPARTFQIAISPAFWREAMTTAQGAASTSATRN